MLSMETPSGELRFDTRHHTWWFDRLRRRFCRLPLNRAPTDPAVAAAWEPYCSLWRGADGALTVLLDQHGTLRMRVSS